MIKILVLEVKYMPSKGDTGDGGSVQSMYHPLISKYALSPWSWFISCLMYALRKCLYRACKAVFGKQGTS